LQKRRRRIEGKAEKKERKSKSREELREKGEIEL